MTDQNPSPQSVVVPDPLWMMHVIGPDDIYPAPDHATAVQWCAYLNSEIAPKVPSVLCVAVPAIWTGTAEEHADGLAEAIKGWAVPTAPAPSSLAGGEVERAARALLDACIADFGDPADYPDDDGWVASGDNGDSAVTFKHLRDLQAALSPEAPAREGSANDNPLTFGMGALVVNTGRFGGDNAVFIARAKEPGEVGAFTGKSAFDRKVLQPGELVMIFPTAEQAQVVADALVGALTPRHEAPAEGAGELIATIRTRLIGVSPDDQDVVLEDRDWLMIVAALEAAK